MSRRGDLESAVSSATQAAVLAQEFVGRALGLDRAIEDSMPLSASDASLVMYALGEVVAKCKAVERAYFAPLLEPAGEAQDADQPAA